MTVVWVEDRGEFLALISDNREVLVDFTAPGWCQPCKQLAPHYEKVAELAGFRSDNLGQMKFVAVDVDKAPWAMADYGVRGVPTLKLFRDASVVGDLRERTAPKILSELSRL